MNKEDHLKALLERAKELKEIGEKLIKESNQLMSEYEAQRLKKGRRARSRLRRTDRSEKSTSL